MVLGILADVGMNLDDDVIFLFAAATPWVLVAFSAGRGSTRYSPLVGSGTLLAGLATHYLWLHLGMGVSWGVLTGSGFRGTTWIVVGAVAGAVSGGIGGLTRHPHSLVAALAWCGAVAVPCADGYLQFAYGAVSPGAAVAVFGGAALALLVWAWGGGVRIWVLALGAPPAALILSQLEVLVLQEAFGRPTWI